MQRFWHGAGLRTPLGRGLWRMHPRENQSWYLEANLQQDSRIRIRSINPERLGRKTETMKLDKGIVKINCNTN